MPLQDPTEQTKIDNFMVQELDESLKEWGWCKQKVSTEDPFDQDDWEHFAKMTAEIGEQVQIVGDDLIVTNPKVKLYTIIIT